jgi:hypothetical protein
MKVLFQIVRRGSLSYQTRIKSAAGAPGGVVV